jgi:hypothetical protein
MPPAVDPHSVPETLCAGKFNIVLTSGGYATLTFTHTRRWPLLDAGQISEESVVRARIVMPMANFVALRDLLNSTIAAPSLRPGAAPVSSPGRS